MIIYERVECSQAPQNAKPTYVFHMRMKKDLWRYNQIWVMAVLCAVPLIAWMCIHNSYIRGCRRYLNRISEKFLRDGKMHIRGNLVGLVCIPNAFSRPSHMTIFDRMKNLLGSPRESYRCPSLCSPTFGHATHQFEHKINNERSRTYFL